LAQFGGGNASVGASSNVSAVATYTGSTAIEGRRFGGVTGPFWPVVVWLVAGVTTFVAECLLVDPSEVTVPAEEIALHILDTKAMTWKKYRLTVP
jgi:hypothetical protein